jgi:hypothetical protein
MIMMRVLEVRNKIIVETFKVAIRNGIHMLETDSRIRSVSAPINEQAVLEMTPPPPPTGSVDKIEVGLKSACSNSPQPYF